jgi:hypothetical protein
MKAKILPEHPNHVIIECPACGHWHVFDERWSFNGDLEKPTFNPSMLVNGGADMEKYINEHNPRCHSFVTDGRIQFLGDCSHNMKGQTVELPDIE